ncbi:hypothetical protein LENED_009059 [Lentinula edodes]|uniref:Uncharacterized protein n=1 Tax=Lentinula edodes TaxID=5353 RepID=A0A1Q3EIS3_LENED|nr:hypothetical protein LENED_009059 [Lentinula edodes]
MKNILKCRMISVTLVWPLHLPKHDSDHDEFGVCFLISSQMLRNHALLPPAQALETTHGAHPTPLDTCSD